MKIWGIPKTQINTYLPGYQQSGSSNNSLDQRKMSHHIFFTAKKYPSGIYSNWFVDLVKEKIVLKGTKFLDCLEQYLSDYKADLFDEDLGHALFHFGGDIKVRKKDFLTLARDLEDGKGCIDLGIRSLDDHRTNGKFVSYSFLRGFSSPTDYRRRTGSNGALSVFAHWSSFGIEEPMKLLNETQIKRLNELETVGDLEAEIIKQNKKNVISPEEKQRHNAFLAVLNAKRRVIIEKQAEILDNEPISGDSYPDWHQMI